MRFYSFLSMAAVVAASLCATPALAQQQPSAPTTAAAENPTMTTLARAQIEAFRAGKIDRSAYTSEASAHITDVLVSQVSQLLNRGGPVKTFAYSGNVLQSGVQVAQYNVTFDHPIATPEMPTLPTTANWVESIATDQSGKISYLLFAPKM